VLSIQDQFEVYFGQDHTNWSSELILLARSLWIPMQKINGLIEAPESEKINVMIYETCV